MNHLKKNYKRKQFDLIQKDKLIQKENIHLIRHILDVDGKQERVRKETYYRHPNRNEQISMHYIRSAQEQHKISKENRDILTRIVSAKSQYNVHKWEEDYYKKIALVSALHEGNYNLPPSRPISAINDNYIIGGKVISSKIHSRYSRYKDDDGDMDEDELEEILFEKNNKIKEDRMKYYEDDDRLDFSKEKPTPKIPSNNKMKSSKQRPFSAHPSLIAQKKLQPSQNKSSDIENNNSKPPLYKKPPRPFSANYPSASSQSRDYELNNNEMKYNEIDEHNDKDEDSDEGMNYDVEINPNYNDNNLSNQMNHLSLNEYTEQQEKQQQSPSPEPPSISIPQLQIDNTQNNYNHENYEYKENDSNIDSIMKDSPLPSNRDISPRRRDNKTSPIVSPKKSRNLDDNDDDIEDLLKPDVSFNDQLYNNNKSTLSNPSTPNTQRSHISNNNHNDSFTNNESKLSERKEEEEEEELVRIPSQRNVLLYNII